jgi:hypothetical protein
MFCFISFCKNYIFIKLLSEQNYDYGYINAKILYNNKMKQAKRKLVLF